MLRDLLENSVDNTRMQRILGSPERPTVSQAPVAPPSLKPPPRQANRGSTSASPARTPAPLGAANAQMVDAYDEMHGILMELAARHVPMPSGPWWQESASDHLRLFWSHLFRAIYVALVPASWRTRSGGDDANQMLLNGSQSDTSFRKSDKPMLSKHNSLALDDGTEIGTNESGNPEVGLRGA